MTTTDDDDKAPRKRPKLALVDDGFAPAPDPLDLAWYDLNDLGKKADNENPEIGDPALAELDEFEAELVECDPEGVTRTSTP